VKSDFDRTILNRTGHRPWPIPDRPWTMMQTWNDLLFAHWAIDPQVLRAAIPNVLELDTYDRHAWLGVVPFRMTNVGLRGLGPLPGVSAFPELNVRTYVRMGDRPGVYFFSLDATNAVAVATARLMGLRYFLASMSVGVDGDAVTYRSRRRLGGEAELHGRYHPVGPIFEPTPGSLEYFLTERYCLYTTSGRGVVRRLEIHHPPWRLQRAEAEVLVNTMGRPLGLDLSRRPDVLHFSRRQDSVAWMPQSIGVGGG
jgi:uncharacterized protein YqjF (DUF2071 family)